ncbi:MAG: ABC transporter ATP-binding protein [Pseudomonadota bacterium]
MIEVRNITKRYGTREAVRGLAFELAEDEILAVIGPSGCGKTTLLRLLSGFERPDSGEIYIDGAKASAPQTSIAPHRRGISLIFQDLALWPHMTAAEHIYFVLRTGKAGRGLLKEEMEGILRSVDLMGYGNRYPGQLSGGEKQRLAIARAIASRSKYLLMDEPLSSLDPLLKKELQELIVKLRNTFHMGIIYVTHNMEEAFALADRIVIMNTGKLEQVGRKEDLVKDPRNGFVRKFLGVE